MTEKQHLSRHKKLHEALDELISDWISSTQLYPSKTSIIELVKWSHSQTIKPDHKCNETCEETWSKND